MSALFRDRCAIKADAVPLYARLDVVQTDAGPALLEAELFEPSYFVDTAPGSAQRFASAVRARLSASMLL